MQWVPGRSSSSLALLEAGPSEIRPAPPGPVCPVGLARWAVVSRGCPGPHGPVLHRLDRFAGGLGGLFLLAIFTRRTHATGALLGLLASGVLQLLLRQFYPVHASFYPATGIIFCLVIGYSASIIIPQKEKSIEGLTIFTLSQAADRS